MKRFLLVGGSPFRMYTGTKTFLSLKIVAEADTKEAIEELSTANYDQCGGLVLVIDTDEPAVEDVVFIDDAVKLLDFNPTKTMIENWLCGGSFPGAKLNDDGRWQFSRAAINVVNQELKSLDGRKNLDLPGDMEDDETPPFL